MELADRELERLVEGVVSGDRRAVARALRWVDEAPPVSRVLGHRLHPHLKGAQVVGITGNPGAGKSTVVDDLIALLRAKGRRVGVLAIDPTSPFSGGAILGDRIRMSRHTTDDGVFIRSLATRGALGGLSRATFDSVRVLDAAGYDVVLVETVGVGQDEVDVARLAHTTAVILVPGLGDDIQALKAGILEVADLFVINKADREGADEVERSLKQLLALLPTPDGWEPPIVRTVATQSSGIEEMWSAIERHRAFLAEPAGRAHIRRQAEQLFERLLDAALVDEGRRSLGEAVREAGQRVLDEGADPYGEVLRILGRDPWGSP